MHRIHEGIRRWPDIDADLADAIAKGAVPDRCLLLFADSTDARKREEDMLCVASYWMYHVICTISADYDIHDLTVRHAKKGVDVAAGPEAGQWTLTFHKHPGTDMFHDSVEVLSLKDGRVVLKPWATRNTAQ